MTDGVSGFLQEIFLGTPAYLVRVLIIGILAYVALVIILRLSGKRTLSAMNAFAFIVTVALGSTLASVITSRDVSLAEGVLALGILVGLQYIVSRSSVRSLPRGRVPARRDAAGTHRRKRDPAGAAVGGVRLPRERALDRPRDERGPLGTYEEQERRHGIARRCGRGPTVTDR